MFQRDKKGHFIRNNGLSDRRQMQVIIGANLPSCCFYVMTQRDGVTLFCMINQGLIIFIYGEALNEFCLRSLFSDLIHYAKQITVMPLTYILFILVVKLGSKL